jgi:predicted transglutaminase-like cysteine proteinase
MRVLIFVAFAFAFVISSNEPSFAASHLAATRFVGPPPPFISACHRYAWLCLTHSGKAMGDQEALALLKQINSRVNAEVIPAEDIVTYGRQDYWSLPTNGRGDCEDYALLKKKELQDAGFKSDKLAMTVVLDRNGGNHSVLMARLAGGDYILDNLSSSVRAWEDTGYTFIARQNFQDERRWEVILAGPRASQVASR